MLNRTVHQAASFVQVPVPYRLAQEFKAKGYDLNILVRDLLEKLAASNRTDDTARKLTEV
ncbi:hypothetical protein [Methyloterricola oryzae]|uniref:hypothetical protein n=1 Tax=Methyloterricola oryzae TaxID=1495050 RepID=UPI0011AF4C49|nr:hypothetical protein [Methyloterricola oryzae]